MRRVTGRALPLAAQGGNGNGGAGSENGNGGSPASVKAAMEKQLDNLAGEALAQTAVGRMPIVCRRRIGNPSYGSAIRPTGVVAGQIPMSGHGLPRRNNTSWTRERKRRVSINATIYEYAIYVDRHSQADACFCPTA